MKSITGPARAGVRGVEFPLDMGRIMFDIDAHDGRTQPLRRADKWNREAMDQRLHRQLQSNLGV